MTLKSWFLSSEAAEAGTKAPGVSDPPRVTEWLPREGSVNLPALISPCSKINSFVKTSF